MYTQAQKKAHIYELQEMLYQICLHGHAIPPVIPDGIYGAETAGAVRAFQETHGLRVTGEVNGLTWKAIADAAREAALPEAVFPLRVVQAALLDFAERTDSIPRCPVTGEPDRETVQALQLFQRLCALPVTGEADGATCRRVGALIEIP